MKAIILASGYGTRMYPLTENTAKGLLLVSGKPVMDWIFENLSEVELNEDKLNKDKLNKDKLNKDKLTENKLTEIVLIVNNKFFRAFEDWAKKWNSKFKITLINDGTNCDEEKLGALKSLLLGWNSFSEKAKKNSAKTDNAKTDNSKIDSADEKVLVLASDNILGFKLKDFTNTEIEKNSCLVAAHDLHNLEQAKKHGIIEISKSNSNIAEIICLEEKPQNPKSSLASICCYLFNEETKSLLESYLENGNKDNTGNFIKYLIGKQKVNAFLFEEKVYDIGSMESYALANRELNANKELTTNKEFTKNTEIDSIVICSGYFDPLHEGHIENFELAKKLGKKLIVIVNNHYQAILKNGKEFIPEKTRLKVVETLKPVDGVFLSIDEDRSVCKSIEAVVKQYPKNTKFIFAKGGDRFAENIPENEVCKKFNVELVSGLGQKINSSSEIKKSFQK
jgi:cytidyltransferase-like protein